MLIRSAIADDVPGIVKVHLDAFPNFFLTMLGERFLNRFYRASIRNPGCLCFVALDGVNVVGFVVGPLEPRGFFRSLFRHEGVGFMIDAVPALMRSPLLVARRLLRGAFSRGESPDVRERAALISSIAVSPNAAGAGLGKQLINTFCSEARNRGSDFVYLLTDREENRAINDFYLRAGFEFESAVQRVGARSMNRYTKDLRLNPTTHNPSQ